jgi:hypothetical protein
MKKVQKQNATLKISCERKRAIFKEIFNKYHCSAPCEPFLYGERLLQQNGDIRKRDGRETACI